MSDKNFKSGFARWLEGQGVERATDGRSETIQSLRKTYRNAKHGLFVTHAETVRVEDADLRWLLWQAISQNWLAGLAEQRGRRADAARHRRSHDAADREIFSDRFGDEDREVAGEILNYLCG
jgi:hypothetical protein